MPISVVATEVVEKLQEYQAAAVRGSIQRDERAKGRGGESAHDEKSG